MSDLESLVASVEKLRRDVASLRQAVEAFSSLIEVRKALDEALESEWQAHEAALALLSKNPGLTD